jgi:hypothetical protein
MDELICIGCHRAPGEIDEYVRAAAEVNEDEPHHSVPMTPERYVRKEEGTLNRQNGHFACTECYMKMGMPVAPHGWVAP